MSARFIFRLQRLLELRERQVEECQKKLAQAMLAAAAAEADVECVKNEETRLNQDWQQEARRALAPAAALNFEHCSSVLARMHLAAEKRSVAAHTEEFACRNWLAAALNKQKALENLKERLLERFTKDALKREQSQLDEFALIAAVQEAS